MRGFHRGWLVSLLVACVILLLAGVSHPANIYEINQAIQVVGGKWVAKETPLSNLAPEEMKKWTGEMEPEPDMELLSIGEIHFVKCSFLRNKLLSDALSIIL